MYSLHKKSMATFPRAVQCYSKYVTVTTAFNQVRFFSLSPDAAATPQVKNPDGTFGSPTDVMNNKELEMLRVKGGRMEYKQLNALANILKFRMTARLPTLLEFQGPQATLNAVKAVTYANSRLRQRRKIENVTEEELNALQEYISMKEKDGTVLQDIKIESDFKFYERFSQHEGHGIVADLVADIAANEPATDATNQESDSALDTNPADTNRMNSDPARIDFDVTGEKRVNFIKEKLQSRKSGDAPIQHVLVTLNEPITLGFIPSQFRVQDDQGYRFVMRMEPVIIGEIKDNLVKEKCKLIFPPRDRDMLFQSATILRKLWIEHLEQNGPELLCCAAGAESVSRVIKMLECANTLQEKNGVTQFCVRPQIVREGQRDGALEDGEQLRFHYQFDFYAL